MNKIDLSIIIPHYNSPKTLRKLLESIPVLDSLEVIVVDDKSDKYTEELREIRSDKRFEHVLFLSNDTEIKGAGKCRNIGLSLAKGKWVLFADSDDFFVEGFYDIVSKYFDTDYDVIFFTPTSVYLETGAKAKRHLTYEKLIDNFLNKGEDSELFLRFYFKTPTSKIINRQFLIENDIKFSEVIVCNDDFFSVKVGLAMRKFTATKETIYCITDHENSLSKKKDRMYFWCCFNEVLKINEYAKNKLSPSDFKKVEICVVELLYASLRKYSISLSDVLKAYMELKKHRMPFLSTRLVKMFIQRFVLKRK
ncbi:glycosyl transferase [Fervidobacterium pennivorans DSM 9078]|uniref:Glycosyl transferase n=1 Tax=Fervidobacterium pennivorans (strain DSM 9078 / Ven5) TaxID=771875 RepID=H9U9T0_FERPD|nr:glycosyltransferase family A protein [Fervidobacterium pennivorans]AFG34273.1 glycosyl transferase [Fervidobacterium pennivorans DSM 9078]